MTSLFKTLGAVRANVVAASAGVLSPEAVAVVAVLLVLFVAFLVNRENWPNMLS